MRFDEALDYLYGRLPVFQNIGARAYKPGLDTTEAFCAHLGTPQRRFRCIHVGGTNGKGSSSHMLAAVLQKAGYKTGLYTSPHLKSFTERIRVDGQPADPAFIAAFTESHKAYIEEINPSFFEVTVAMAFDYFARCGVEVAVVEVGMGGRLDSTNIITPVVSLITNISFDHMQHLGGTLPEIAAEKAGIIKPGVPVVISEEMDEEVMDVFSRTAALKNAKMHVAAREWSVSGSRYRNGRFELQIEKINSGKKYPFDNLVLDLAGEYQKNNIRGVLSVLELLRREETGFAVTQRHLREGLREVVRLTGLKGRWQQLRDAPLVIADTAHNQAGLQYTLAQFKSLPARTRRFVIGFVADKDLEAVLRLFPADAVYYFCQPSNPRALKAGILAGKASSSGLRGTVYPDVNEGLSAALRDADPQDAVYVGGSTFVVADLAHL